MDLDKFGLLKSYFYFVWKYKSLSNMACRKISKEEFIYIRNSLRVLLLLSRKLLIPKYSFSLIVLYQKTIIL